MPEPDLKEEIANRPNLFLPGVFRPQDIKVINVERASDKGVVVSLEEMSPQLEQVGTIRWPSKLFNFSIANVLLLNRSFISYSKNLLLKCLDSH